MKRGLKNIKKRKSENTYYSSMRNETTNVVRKISSIVSEIEPYQSATLTVADSNSYDGTRLAAEDFLRV